MPRRPLFPKGSEEDRKHKAEIRSAIDKRYRARKNLAAIMKRRQGKDLGFLAELVALLPGGFKDVFPYFRQAGATDDRFEAVIEAFDNIPHFKWNAEAPMKFEDICRNLNVSVSEFFGAAMGQAYEHKLNVTRLMTALAMPEVMKTNIAMAKKPSGLRDRQMFMESARILPVPAGSTVNVLAASNASVTQSGEPSGMPSFEETAVTLSEVIRNAVESRTNRLPEPPTVILPAEDTG